MSKFKVGDKVRLKKGVGIEKSSCSFVDSMEEYIGSITTITQVRYDPKGNSYKVENNSWNWDSIHLELIINNTITNMKEKFIQMFLSEPEKSFRKAEITNGDGLLTDDGQTVFLSWLLKKYGTDFKTDVVDGLLAEEKK